MHLPDTVPLRAPPSGGRFRAPGLYCPNTVFAPISAAVIPAELWQFYIQLTEVEAAFKNLKDDLSLRPIYHRLEARIEAHIFIAFMAYCLQITLRARLRSSAPGLTARAVLEKMAALRMIDVHLLTSDGRTLILSRYTQPEADQKLLLAQLKLILPPSPHHASAPEESCSTKTLPQSVL